MGEELGKAAFSHDFAKRRLLVDLTSQPDLERLRAIVSGERAGKELLAGTIWGSIRWSPNLGRPKTPTLAEGLKVKHSVDQTFTDEKNGVKIPVTVPVPMTGRNAPILWDGADLGGQLQVLFMTHGGSRVPDAIVGPVNNANRFEFELAPEVEWTGTGPFHLARALAFVPPAAVVILNNDVEILEIEIRAERLGG